MKCLLKYQWIKLPRNQLPPGKGIMGIWARLASRAAFRSGKATYCGYINEVTVGTWAGGIVGLKSIMDEAAAAGFGDDGPSRRSFLYWVHTGSKIEETYIQDHRLGCKVLWRALYGP